MQPLLFLLLLVKIIAKRDNNKNLNFQNKFFLNKGNSFNLSYNSNIIQIQL
jgi:hypothetical protein